MPKGKLFDTAVQKETCVLVRLATQHQKREQLKYLDELAFLVTTANAETKRTFIKDLQGLMLKLSWVREAPRNKEYVERRRKLT